jgi:outer membrane protein OmpA-like peptidoglycan-associated protein
VKSGGAQYVSTSSSAVVVAFALPARPTTVKVNFAVNVKSLSAADKTLLKVLAKKLIKSASVTITGYAKGNAALALRRAKVVAAELKSLVTNLHVTFKVATKVNAKTTVATTKQ